MNKFKIINFIIFILLIALYLFSGCIDLKNNNVNDTEGEDFSFLGLDGLEKKLSDFRGKGSEVFIFFL